MPPRTRTPVAGDRTHSATAGQAGTAAPPPPSSAAAYSMQIFDEMVRIRPSLKPYLLEIGLDTGAQWQQLGIMVADGQFFNMADALAELERAMKKDYRPLTVRPRRGMV